MSISTKILNIGCAKGFFDKTPSFMRERKSILIIIDQILKKHGVEKLETPIFELNEIYENKVNKCCNLIQLNDQGGELLSLRYDLKFPLTRYLAMDKIESHLKISQSGYIYRKEKIDVKNFRLREFFVTDLDICGPSDPMICEIQCLRICCDLIRGLEINEPIKIHIGHKRMTELILRLVSNVNDSQASKLIGKLSENTIRSSIDWKSAQKSIGEKIITEETIRKFKDKIDSLGGNFDEVINQLGRWNDLNALKEGVAVVKDLIQFVQYCQSFLLKSDLPKIYFDFNLIGSRSFYSGIVFAARLKSGELNLLSGGHYESLSRRILPRSKDTFLRFGGTGFSLGVDQLVLYRMASRGEPIEGLWLEDNPANEGKGDRADTRKNKPERPASSDENVLKNVKGTMDRSPQQMVVRERVFNTIVECFKRHNADTIDTPAVELHDVLMGKYGEDSKLIYDLNDIDNEKLSLRYDLTVPFARYVAMHGDILDNKVFKRYQIGKVYRRDNPSISRGRYREFYQCDFDIAGYSENLMEPDFECLSIVYEVLRDLKLGDYRIKVNHRKFLDGMLEVCGVPEKSFRTICSSIDKLDKTPWDEVKIEMLGKEISKEVANNIGNYVNRSGGMELIDELENDATLMKSENVQTALKEMRILLNYCSKMMDKIRFDLSLARGLDYYTGMIFEAVFTEFESKPQKDGNNDEQQIAVGSVSGGGRYDNLVNMFSESDKIIPCVGLSIGVERLMAIYEKTKMSDARPESSKQIMVISAQKDRTEERFKLLSMLLEAGITATQSMKKNPKVLDEFQECEKLAIPYAVIIGDDELKLNAVTLRKINDRTQESVPRSEIVAKLKDVMKEYNEEIY